MNDSKQHFISAYTLQYVSRLSIQNTFILFTRVRSLYLLLSISVTVLLHFTQYGNVVYVTITIVPNIIQILPFLECAPEEFNDALIIIV